MRETDEGVDVVDKKTRDESRANTRWEESKMMRCGFLDDWSICMDGEVCDWGTGADDVDECDWVGWMYARG